METAHIKKQSAVFGAINEPYIWPRSAGIRNSHPVKTVRAATISATQAASPMRWIPVFADGIEASSVAIARHSSPDTTHGPQHQPRRAQSVSTRTNKHHFIVNA